MPPFSIGVVGDRAHDRVQINKPVLPLPSPKQGRPAPFLEEQPATPQDLTRVRLRVVDDVVAGRYSADDARRTAIEIDLDHSSRRWSRDPLAHSIIAKSHLKLPEADRVRRARQPHRIDASREGVLEQPRLLPRVRLEAAPAIVVAKQRQMGSILRNLSLIHI